MFDKLTEPFLLRIVTELEVDSNPHFPELASGDAFRDSKERGICIAGPVAAGLLSVRRGLPDAAALAGLTGGLLFLSSRLINYLVPDDDQADFEFLITISNITQPLSKYQEMRLLPTDFVADVTGGISGGITGATFTGGKNPPVIPPPNLKKAKILIKSAGNGRFFL
ncbi:hypothetical protein PIB30_023947 [Stylosanthes scabra]|uniref:Uncharacterized protein n=1 Tax=Stylosanthes scabra TaxID=79078 RepID=A0ABU6WBH8_9FABA|nr:hypothetical protein [Stylosanthes scabra]